MPPSNDIVDRFSTHVKNILTRALCFAVENGRPMILPEHLLWALGTERGGVGAKLLTKLGVKTEGLRLLALTERTEPSKGPNDPASPQLSEAAKHAIEKAVLTANAHEHRYVGTEHLLAGLVQIHAKELEQFFEQQKIETKELSEQLALALHSASRYPDLAASVTDGATESTSPVMAGLGEERAQRNQALAAFGRELTSTEWQEKIDPVIGRERELERVMEILCRRTKNNPLLIGEPGVGKTAIVEGLAKLIHAGDVPPALAGRRIVSVDLASMIAGTMYRGEFEQRIRHVMEEARAHPEIILFIDEIHTVVGAGATSGSLDAANILKPALARGELRCIGATTLSEFKKHIEPDAALERRFQSVQINEPTAERTLKILQGLAPAYEEHHHVHYTPDALQAAITLSLRFLQDRRLPDKAIDLMDEAGASARVRSHQPEPQSARVALERQLADLQHKKNEAVLQEQFGEALALKEEVILLEKKLGQVAATVRTDKATTVDANEIAQVVSRLSGLALTDVMHEAIDPLTIRTLLEQRVFGQDATLQKVSQAIARAKAGLQDARRPLSSFLFLGPSGVGKTELAKAMAEAAFQDPRALIRLDMSEYAEAFTASKLVGAPAGYVGYKDAAKLTDQVRRRPHCVVLFDEIEKAHVDVQNLLLQLLEEGEISDASGVPVSFRNAIIVLTSNAGAERFRNGEIGFGSGKSQPMDVRKEVTEHFRPELLNRLEHVLLFDPLSFEALRDVAAKQVAELAVRLHTSGRSLKTTDAVADFLAKRVNLDLGARDLRRLVQTHIEDQMAELLTQHPKGFRLEVKGDAIVVRST